VAVAETDEVGTAMTIKDELRVKFGLMIMESHGTMQQQ
jgi:hypothetical protein